MRTRSFLFPVSSVCPTSSTSNTKPIKRYLQQQHANLRNTRNNISYLNKNMPPSLWRTSSASKHSASHHLPIPSIPRTSDDIPQRFAFWRTTSGLAAYSFARNGPCGRATSCPARTHRWKTIPCSPTCSDKHQTVTYCPRDDVRTTRRISCTRRHSQ